MKKFLFSTAIAAGAGVLAFCLLVRLERERSFETADHARAEDSVGSTVIDPPPPAPENRAKARSGKEPSGSGGENRSGDAAAEKEKRHEGREKENRFTVRIVDAGTGLPLEAPAASIVDMASGKVFKPGEDGAISIPDDGGREPLFLEASADGFSKARLVVRQEGSIGSLELSMTRLHGLTAVFTAPGGEPLGGVEVFLQASGSGWSGSRLHAVSGTDGVARFHEFPAGSGTEFSFAASREGFSSLARTLSFEEYAAAHALIRVELKPCMRFRGRLLGTGRWPARLFEVEYAFRAKDACDGAAALEPARKATVNREGAFAAEGSSAGRALARAIMGKEVVFFGEVEFAQGIETPVDISRACEIKIAVRDEAGMPVFAAGVTMARLDPGFEPAVVSGKSGDAGIFKFIGTAPGRYSGSVLATGFDEKAFDFALSGGERKEAVEVEVVIARGER